MSLPVEIENIGAKDAPVIYVKNGLQPFLDHIREQVSGEVPDLETLAGRKRIASLAAQVSRSKTAVEKPGRDYLKLIKAKPKEIEAELREFVNACDTLRDQIRKPLTDWENAEIERVKNIQQKITEIKQVALVKYEVSIKASEALNHLMAIKIDESFEEFKADAALAKEEAVSTLNDQVDLLVEKEAEAAKQAQLQKEAEERARIEREEQLKREAREQAERENQEAIAQAKRDKEAAEQRAIEAEEKAKRDAEEKLAKQQREAEEAQKRAQQAEAETCARIEREAREKAEAEAAARAKEEADEQARRENVEHQKQVNQAILNALMEHAGLSLLNARNTVIAVVKGQVPNMGIKY